jgi:predicted amidohydrolase
MAKKIGIAIAQVGGIGKDETRTEVVQRLIALLEQAATRQAALVVFPELTLTTFFPRYWFDSETETESYFEASMPNADVQPLFDRAKELGIGFYLGYAERTDSGQHFNASILVDRSGEIIGKYRKVHLPGHKDFVDNQPNQHLEKRYFEVGDLGFGVFDFDGIRIGMCLCNDRRWPEVYRVLALQGADLVLLGYNTPDSVPGWQEEPHAKMFSHLLSLQAGAYQNSVWVAAAGKSGFEDEHHLIGGSALVAPSGEVVAKAFTEADEIIFGEIDIDMCRMYQESVFNFSAHRRPEEYGLIVSRTGRGEPLPTPAI